MRLVHILLLPCLLFSQVVSGEHGDLPGHPSPGLELGLTELGGQLPLCPEVQRLDSAPEAEGLNGRPAGPGGLGASLWEAHPG